MSGDPKGEERPADVNLANGAAGAEQAPLQKGLPKPTDFRGRAGHGLVDALNAVAFSPMALAGDRN